ncbi:MAG: GntR family transcriptional regulator, partial [Thalassobaculaceae bacterium]|nr:GntR family transcriptional regulator [Thalassobaculaceae bacterium]
MAVAKPIERVTLSTQVAERIRGDILSGAFQPGEQLHEVELALSLGVSRGPLREAMQRLVQEGLLTSLPHRGVFVIDLSEDDLLDVYFVRASLEEAAIRRVVARSERTATAAALTAVARGNEKA